MDRELRALHAARDAFAAALAPLRPAHAVALRRPGRRPALGARRVPEPDPERRAEAGPGPPTGDLGNTIAARRLSFGLDAMEFGPGPGPANFGAMISLKDYPARTAPGLL